MSSIATCPQCAAQLAVPETASASDHAQCPECQAEFSLAEGDMRFLMSATIVDPIETAPQVVVPTPIEPVLEAPSMAAEQTEAPLEEIESTQEMRNAETILSPSTLSGWEERLRTAIDSTKSATADEPELGDSSSVPSTASTLENAPEFEFEIDPPAENPSESFAPSSTKLSETGEWFEDTPEKIPEEFQETASHEPPDELPTSSKQAAPPRRTKNSFLKRVSVVALFGTVGILLGQYALYWLRGPSADYLHIAQFVPKAIFPSSRHQVLAPQIDVEEYLATDNTPIVEPEIEPPVETSPPEELIAETSPPASEPIPPTTQPEVTRDDLVQPANVQLPDELLGQRPSLLPPTNTTAAEFEQLVASARDSAQVLIDGDLLTRESFRAMGHAYIALCQLAERIDFVQAANLNAAARDEALSAQALFRALAKQASVQNDLALIASRWWQHQDRSNRGIYLVGKLLSVEAHGSYILGQMSVVHGGEPTLIPVLLPAGSTFQAGDRIGVVGTILDQPSNEIPDLPADLPLVAVAVDSFSAPAE